MLLVKKKTISCICGDNPKKSGLTNTSKQCVCTLISNGKEKSLGFPVTVNVTRDRDEPKRQRRKN